MKKLIVLGAVALMALLLITSVASCQQQPQPEEPPSLAIMVESNVVDAGSSFMISGSNLDPYQKVWAEFNYKASDRGEDVSVYGEPDEEGTIHAVIPVPEDIVPGDYEVEIYVGKHLDDRELIATLPIHIQAKEK